MFKLSLYTLMFTLVAASALGERASPSSAALLQDAASYAARFSVDVDEAVRRLQLQKEAGDLDAVLSSEERATFAGLWIEHEPRYRVVVRFTDKASERRLASRLAGGNLKGLVETKPARWTLAELEAQQNEGRALSRRAGVPINSDVNVFENRVEIHALDPQELNVALTSMRTALPPAVEVKRVRDLAVTESLTGGAPLTTCTAGFTVTSPNFDMGVLTAGHCPDQQTFEGSNLAMRAQDVNGEQDVQWHSSCDFLPVTNLFFTGIDLRACTGTRHRLVQPIGQFLCKYGKATGRTCGVIQSKTYDPGAAWNATFVLVSGGNVNLSEEADSGGPWFVENDAYGIQAGAPNGGVSNDAYYMPINYVSSLGVSVLTAPAAPGGCNTPPIASFTFARRFDASVTFDGSASTDPDGVIVRYEWDFGDGTRATTSTPTVVHQYPRETNTFPIVLTVTDVEGKKGTATKELVLCYPASDCVGPIL